MLGVGRLESHSESSTANDVQIRFRVEQRQGYRCRVAFGSRFLVVCLGAKDVGLKEELLVESLLEQWSTLHRL